MEERWASLTQQLKLAIKESLDWQNKFDHAMAEQWLEEERFKSEHASLQSRCSAAEARLIAAREQSESAKEEAMEWCRKHDSVLVEAKSTAERYNSLRERGNKLQQQRKDLIRGDFVATLSKKEALMSEA